MPTKQQTFDTVVAHLRKQGKQALDERGHCSYRTATGLKCAAGCLIPDEAYQPRFEGRAVSASKIISDYTNADADRALRDAIVRAGHDPALVARLQEIHDDDKSAWEYGFDAAASEFDLIYTPPA